MKRIVTCSDGTWNRPNMIVEGKEVNSNVSWMYDAICKKAEKRVTQCKVYDTGVGSSTFSVWDKIAGGITGEGIDRKIKDMYSFLVLNYEPGDELYLFGFSRGAYTARSLAGFIYNCGILKPENLHHLDRAYELYRNRNDYSKPDSDLMISFRRNFCADLNTPIRFLGVWDTVGSLGIPLPVLRFYNRERYKFHDEKLNGSVHFAYHALAIDERRFLFTPTLWEQSNKPVRAEMQVKSDQVMEQRWFAGVHCNVGGGYPDRGLSDIALMWLVDKARLAGLCFDEEKLKRFSKNYDGELYNSYTPLYWWWIPRWRTIGGKPGTHQTIDDSVWERYASLKVRYKPRNLHKLVKDGKARRGEPLTN